MEVFGGVEGLAHVLGLFGGLLDLLLYLLMFLLYLPALQQRLPRRVQLIDFLPELACIVLLSFQALAADGLDLNAELILVLPALEEVEIVLEFLLRLCLQLRGSVLLSDQGLALLFIWRLSDLREVDLHYLTAFLIVLNGEHFLVILGDKGKLNGIDILLLGPVLCILFLPALLVDAFALVVILLHGPELAVIVDDVGHALPLLVDGLLDLLILLLDDLVYLLRRHQLLAFHLINAHG